MQLMEYPINDSFKIVTPDLSDLNPPLTPPDPSVVYKRALEVKPEIKGAALKTEAAEMEIDIAKADAMPSLALDAGFRITSYNVCYTKLLRDYRYFNNDGLTAGWIEDATKTNHYVYEEMLNSVYGIYSNMIGEA